jgi:catechol 2,3-dioxygenase-like lactoylglutathione lyase family enzyme
MPTLGTVIPLLRIFDEQKAREFYVDFLGFRVDFEHRFGPEFPLYLGVSHSNCQMHLTEHFGDASPGAQVRIEVDDVAGLVADLVAKSYRYAKPGKPELQPWGTIEITLTDPFANRLTFFQPK